MQDTNSNNASLFRRLAIGLIVFVVISMFFVIGYSDNNDSETAQFISGVLLIFLSIPLIASIVLLLVAARIRHNNKTKEMQQVDYSKRIAAYNVSFIVAALTFVLTMYYLELYPAAALVFVFILIPLYWILAASIVPLIILNIYSLNRARTKDKKFLIVGSVSAILFGCYIILAISNH